MNLSDSKMYVIIVTYNAEQWIEDCIKSIMEAPFNQQLL